MTVEEMRKRIEEECENHEEHEKNFNYYCRKKCPLRNCEHCYTIATDEEIKENYELMFGKEESEMKSEFDFNELKAGYAIKVPAYEDELLVGIPCKWDRLVFYSKDFENVVEKEEIIKGCQKEFMPIEVYGFSYYDNLFDPSTRPLLWEKEEDMNTKEYNIGKLTIAPNYDKYKTDKEDEGLYNGFICISVGKDEYGNDSISIHKSELDDVINALTEIKDFIKED